MIAARDIGADEGLWYPFQGDCVQETDKPKALRFMDKEADMFDYYVNQVKEPVREQVFDPAWDMKSAMNMGDGGPVPQFMIVFQFVCIAGSSYGPYLSDSQVSKLTREDIQKQKPVTQESGLMVRVPYLAQKAGFAACQLCSMGLSFSQWLVVELVGPFVCFCFSFLSLYFNYCW